MYMNIQTKVCLEYPVAGDMTDYHCVALALMNAVTARNGLHSE